MFLVIGAGPAGIAAVRGYRQAGGAGEVVVLSRDKDAPYARPPLSKAYLRGEDQPGELDLLEPEEAAQLDFRLVRAAAVDLDPATRTVLDENGIAYRYDTCLLATGCVPAQLPVPGGDDPRLLQLRSLADSRRLKNAAGRAKTAIVIGSGFIGCEAAVSLARTGLSVRQVSDEPLPQQRRLGEAAAGRIAAWLRDEGVELVGGSTVASLSFEEDVEGDDDRAPVRVRLEDGRDLVADVVLVAVGVSASTELAERAGLSLRQGRVVVDASMRTGVDGVLAAGDIVVAQNQAAGRPLTVEHWGEAITMGEIAGSVAAGAARRWENAPGFWSEIGDRVLKYVAWGDGYHRDELVEHADGAFSVWYRDAGGRVVGVLAHEADGDYDRGRRLIETA